MINFLYNKKDEYEKEVLLNNIFNDNIFIIFSKYFFIKRNK